MLISWFPFWHQWKMCGNQHAINFLYFSFELLPCWEFLPFSCKQNICLVFILSSILRWAALVLIFIFLLFIYTFTLNRWCFVCNFSCFSCKLNFLNCLHFVKFAPMSSLIPHSFGGKLCKKSFNHDNFCYIFQLNLNVQVVFFLSNFSSFPVKKCFLHILFPFVKYAPPMSGMRPDSLGGPRH